MPKFRAERAAMLASILTASERARFEKSGLVLEPNNEVNEHDYEGSLIDRLVSAMAVHGGGRHVREKADTSSEMHQTEKFNEIERNDDKSFDYSIFENNEKAIVNSGRNGSYGSVTSVDLNKIDALFAVSISSGNMTSEHPAVVARFIRALPVEEKRDLLRAFSGKMARNVIRFIKMASKKN